MGKGNIIQTNEELEEEAGVYHGIGDISRVEITFEPYRGSSTGTNHAGRIKRMNQNGKSR